jgi:hypothetical protein
MDVMGERGAATSGFGALIEDCNMEHTSPRKVRVQPVSPASDRNVWMMMQNNDIIMIVVVAVVVVVVVMIIINIIIIIIIIIVIIVIIITCSFSSCKSMRNVHQSKAGTRLLKCVTCDV